jgi:hypothetical protein
MKRVAILLFVCFPLMADNAGVLNAENSREVQGFTNDPQSVARYFYAALIRGDNKWRKAATSDDFPSGTPLIPMSKYYSRITLKEAAILGAEPYYFGNSVYQEAVVHVHTVFEYNGAELERNEDAILKLIKGAWKVDIISGPAIRDIYDRFIQSHE